MDVKSPIFEQSQAPLKDIQNWTLKNDRGHLSTQISNTILCPTKKEEKKKINALRFLFRLINSHCACRMYEKRILYVVTKANL